jgi:hypothetical protein
VGAFPFLVCAYHLNLLTDVCTITEIWALYAIMRTWRIILSQWDLACVFFGTIFALWIRQTLPTSLEGELGHTHTLWSGLYGGALDVGLEIGLFGINDVFYVGVYVTEYDHALRFV